MAIESKKKSQQMYENIEETTSTKDIALTRSLEKRSRTQTINSSYPGPGGSLATPLKQLDHVPGSVNLNTEKEEGVGSHPIAGGKRMTRRQLKPHHSHGVYKAHCASCSLSDASEDEEFIHSTTGKISMKKAMVCDIVDKPTTGVPSRASSGVVVRKREAPKEKTLSDMMDKLDIGGAKRLSLQHSPVSVPKKKSMYHMDRRCMSADGDMYHVLRKKWRSLDEEGIERLFAQDEDGDNILMVAIVQEIHSLARLLVSLLKSPTLLDVKNNLFQTALHLAVLGQDSNMVRELVIHGADVTARDRNGNSPLHLACQKNNLSAVIALTTCITPMDREKCIYHVSTELPQRHDIYNYKGQTCLHIAAEGGHFNLFRFLVESNFGADINAPDGLSGRTVLHLAAEAGNKYLVKYLLKRPELDLHQMTYSGDSALDLAIGRGNRKIASYLFKAGVRSSHVSTDTSNSEDEEEKENTLSLEDFEIQKSDESSLEKNYQSLMEDMEYDDFCFNGRSISGSMSGSSFSFS